MAEWKVGIKPQHNMTSTQAHAAFMDGREPFHTPQIKKMAETYKVILRDAFLLEKECNSLIQVSQLPFIQPRLGMKALATLHVLKETFTVAQEMSHFQEKCWCLAQDAITVAELDSEIVSLAANVLAMGYVAHFAAKGMGACFTPTDEGHEIFEVSAQRIDALADDLTMALTRVSLIAVLCGITPN